MIFIFLQETYSIGDYLTFKNIFNPTGDLSGVIPIPCVFEGEMKARGWWGGLRIYAENHTFTDGSGRYIWLLQNSAYNDENAKITYKIPSTWTTFKVIATNETVTLYINDSLIGNTPKGNFDKIYASGGSNSNPIDVRNFKAFKL